MNKIYMVNRKMVGNEMTAPERITVAMDEEIFKVFSAMRDELGLSQSELIRKALKFYSKYRVLIESMEDQKMYTHAEMLKVGEHVIVDIDHWLLFLQFMETHPEKEQFWELNKPIYEAHAELFKHKSYGVEDVLKRLEACNYYTLNQVSKNDYTLILSSDALKKFVKTLLEETFRGMDFTVEIKEDFAKLRVKVLQEAPREKGRS
jgi:Xaa-Pro aminopeptidase